MPASPDIYRPTSEVTQFSNRDLALFDQNPATLDSYPQTDQDPIPHLNNRPEGPRQYDIRFDMRSIENDVVSAEHEDTYREKQLLTMIGERLGLLKSLVTYEFRGDQLYGVGMRTSMLEMIDSGIESRYNLSTPEDRIRQAAERPGFERVQAFLKRSGAQAGDTVISHSAPGNGHPGNEGDPAIEQSYYGENFADKFTLNADGTVTLTRILTNLTLQEHYKLARSLNPDLPQPMKLTDAYLLAHPVLLESDDPANNDELIDRIQKDVQGIQPKDFEAHIVPYLESFIKAYIASTKRDKSLPDYHDQVALHFNAILRKAQELKTAFFAQKEDTKVTSMYDNYRSDSLPELAEIMFLASQPIDEIRTACGLSGAYTIGNPNRAWRVWDMPFAAEGYGFDPMLVGERIHLDDGTFVEHDGYPLEDNIDTRIIRCESKGHRYLRPYYGPRGGTPEPCCRECGGVEGIACAEPKTEEKSNVIYTNNKKKDQEAVEPAAKAA